MDARWIEIERLVRLAQSGDREAFGELCTRFERSVAALARQRVRDPHEADELVQEVFLHAMRKIGQLRNAACFGAWLRRITVRVAINRGMRKQPVAVAETSVLESAVRHGPEPLDDLVREERRRKVRDAVAKLKPIDRDALAAFYLRGRTLLEIAKEFDVPVGTVKRRLHTARRRLQGSLDGSGFGGEGVGYGNGMSGMDAGRHVGSKEVAANVSLTANGAATVRERAPMGESLSGIPLTGATGSGGAARSFGNDARRPNGSDAARQVGNKEVAAKASVIDDRRIGPRKLKADPPDSRPLEPRGAGDYVTRPLKRKRELALAE